MNGLVSFDSQNIVYNSLNKQERISGCWYRMRLLNVRMRMFALRERQSGSERRPFDWSGNNKIFLFGWNGNNSEANGMLTRNRNNSVCYSPLCLVCTPLSLCPATLLYCLLSSAANQTWNPDTEQWDTLTGLGNHSYAPPLTTVPCLHTPVTVSSYITQQCRKPD